MRSTFARGLALITVIGLVVRVTYVLAVRHDAVGGDGFAYFLSAGNLADGKGFIRPPAAVKLADAPHPPLWALALTIPRLLGLSSFLDSQLLAAIIGTTTVAVVGL